MMDTLGSEHAAALEYLYARINYESAAAGPYKSGDWDLSRMRELLARLGHPQNQYPIVHVAGTKGKGSTATMVARILQAAGYKVGLYTSPHLTRLEERFQLAGEPASAADLVALTAAVRPVVAELDRELVPETGKPLTFFEITTAMGMLHFARQGVDWGVLEVGLGGRLDATNACLPAVSVITSISLDHTRQLGSTLASIAREKAGIIKEGIPVVSGVTPDEPRRVIEEIAAAHRSSLWRLDRDFRAAYRPPREQTSGQVDFAFVPPAGTWQLEGVELGMLGPHQAQNAGVALATVQRLREQGWSIADAACRAGLGAARCPGRVEVVSRRPTVILDTAHNLASIEALLATLDESFPAERRTLLLAVSRDKDVAGILRLLLPRCERLILTQFTSNPRAVPAESLAQLTEEVARGLTGPVAERMVFADPVLAWEWWRGQASEDSLICVTGSFFLASELRLLVRG